MNLSSIHQLLPCRMEEKPSRVVTNMRAHTHCLVGGLQSSSPLNLHRGLPRVWTLRGCLQTADHPEPDVSLPSLPPSLNSPSLHPLLSHTIERDRPLPSKTHEVSTLEHTHIPIHTFIYLPATDFHKWSHLGLLLTLNSQTNMNSNSPCVTCSCVGNAFSSDGDEAHSCK